MNQLLAEMLWAAANPSVLVPALLIVSVLLLWTPLHRLGRVLATATLAIVLAVDALNLDGLLGAELEDRFSAPDPLPPKVDGIIVLGGSVDVTRSKARQTVLLNQNGDRLVQFAALSRRYPEAKLVFTGGGPDARHMEESEVSLRALSDLGVDLSRVMLESRSTSTYENAVLSYELVRPGADEVWLLVTSAWHMPRAVGSFRVAGWNVIAFPAGYVTAGGGIGVEWPLRPFTSLANLTSIGREWLSLLVYYRLGRTDAWVPSDDGEVAIRIGR